MTQKKTNSFYRGSFCSELKEFGTKVVNYEQKEMTPLLSYDVALYQVQSSATYVEKGFIMTKNKRDLNYTEKLEIIVILQKNLEELLIAFVIYAIKYPRNSCKNA